MLGHALGETMGSEAFLLGREECDVTDARSVGLAFEKVMPDAVVHAAAWTNVDECETSEIRAKLVHSNGTQNVAEAAARRGARLILISTDYVFAGDLNRPVSEEDTPEPLSVYGRTKFAAEGAAILHYPAPLILRTSAVYGPGGEHFPGSVARQIEAGEPLRVVEDQFVSPTYTRDLADAVYKLLAKPDVAGVYHAANAGAASWYDFAQEIAKAMGKPDHPITPIPSRELRRPAPRPPYSALDCTKLSLEVGILLRPWDEAFRAYYAQEKGVIAA